MTVYQCQPIAGPIHATVSLPGSKSITNRALIVAALADGSSVLRDILLSEDTELMIEALRSLDVPITIDRSGHTVEITGCGGHILSDDALLFCGNSGTTIRFCMALTTLGYGRFVLDGIERMHHRPIGALTDALRRLGGRIEYQGRDGFPPITVHAAGLRGGQVSIHAPQSSQFLSALLLSAPYAAGDVLIEATGPVPSKPYLSMTTDVMEAFGVSVIGQYDDPAGAVRFIVEAPQRYQGRTYTVEPDASNATYFLAAPAVVGGEVTVEGLGAASIQGDVRFVDILEQMGCEVRREANRLTVSRAVSHPLTGVDVDLNDMPDTVPTLAVLALFASGVTTIRNVANLRVKETNRLAALRQELCKLGAEVEELTDGLRITPTAALHPGEIETYNDHRMAMSFALVGLTLPGLSIRNPGCCAKTFPDFFERFEQLTPPSSTR